MMPRLETNIEKFILRMYISIVPKLLHIITDGSTLYSNGFTIDFEKLSLAANIIHNNLIFILMKQ